MDDFRTIDYEGLTTLNIFATQELSRQLKKQQLQINIQQQQIVALVKEIKLLKQPSNKNHTERRVATAKIKKKKKKKKIFFFLFFIILQLVFFYSHMHKA